VRLDQGSVAAHATGTLTGAMRQWGANTTRTYDCAAPPQPATAAALTGTAQRLRLTAFNMLAPVPDGQECSDADEFHAIEALTAVEDAYAATVTVTPEQLARDEFTIPVSRSAGFPSCAYHDTQTCTQRGEWTGTVRFVRRR
jgi:hypothetical protein